MVQQNFWGAGVAQSLGRKPKTERSEVTPCFLIKGNEYVQAEEAFRKGLSKVYF